MFRISKKIALITALLLLFTAVSAPFCSVSAVDLSEFNLTQCQKYFFRVLGSLARADYYETDILASITLSQAIYEGGWGRYSLPVGGCNLFGIKAYSTWSGMVYDQNTSMLYASYEDYLLSAGQSQINTYSAWRAHESWAESVSVHSALFHNESKYAAVVGEKDYSIAANAIVDAGYCNDDGYAATVINLIEQYGMTEYDDLTPDEDGVVAVVTKQERVLMDIGDTYAVPLTFYPADKTATKITWSSDNPNVATVDENGNVTAIAHGMTLISATLANGREACCIVYVDCNATVIDKDAEVYLSPSANASTDGKIYRGFTVKALEEALYSDSEGNTFYKITGYNNKNKLVTGYVLSKYIYLNKRNVSSIAVVKDDITLVKNEEYTVRTAVAPADAVDKELSWISSNETVATVDENGKITAKSLGTAVVTAKAAGGTKREIKVTVASAKKEYRGVVTAYETLTVRSQPSSSSSRVGTLSFLTNVTVIGEPDGLWYKVKGANSSGNIITGYVNSAYIVLVADDYQITYGTAPANVTVYSECDTSSISYRNLVEGTQYAVVGDGEEGWNYIIGLKNPSDISAVHGYAKLTGGDSTQPETPAVTVGYYGRTTSALYIRNSADSGGEILGRFAEGATVIISGDAENGWYKVSGTDINGNEISGYSSANYIVLLYSGVTTSNLNVRDTAETGSVVGRFENGTEITVIGEAVNGWYAVEGKNAAGQTISGYSSASYITINGKLEAEIQSNNGFSIMNSSLSITNGILNGVGLETKVSQLLTSFTGTVSVVDSFGNALASDSFVGTGCKIRVTENGGTYYAATVVVMGDADGDGEVTPSDYVLVCRHFMGTYTLKDCYFKAALITGSPEITISDYVLVKRAYFGTYKIKP